MAGAGATLAEQTGGAVTPGGAGGGRGGRIAPVARHGGVFRYDVDPAIGHADLAAAQVHIEGLGEGAQRLLGGLTAATAVSLQVEISGLSTCGHGKPNHRQQQNP